MVVLIIFSILALFFTFLESIGKMKLGLWLGMLIVTIIAAIHYNFGNDYLAYHQRYLDFTAYRYSFDEILNDNTHGRNEPGWLLVMLLFKPFGDAGFYVMVAALSIFQGVVIYRLIKKFLPAYLYVFALFIYLFNTNLYVGSLSGLRQHLAVTITASTLPWILEKKWLIPLLAVLFASTIHTSAIIFIPFAFWGYISNNRKWLVGVYALAFVVLSLSAGFVQDIVNLFFSNNIGNFQVYEMYTEEAVNGKWGLGIIILYIIPFLVSLMGMLTIADNDNNSFKIIALSTITYAMLPIINSVNLAFRMTYYFEIFSILSLPYCFSAIKLKILRIPLITLYALVTLYVYYTYFHSPIRYESTYIYHSILELMYK